MKRKLADVLWEAANEHLWDGSCGCVGLMYSCWAVEAALGTEQWLGNSFPEVAGFLISLGCNVNAAKLTFQTDVIRERQARRYMWLLLAMHVAEDEGIEIEVGAA